MARTVDPGRLDVPAPPSLKRVGRWDNPQLQPTKRGRTVVVARGPQVNVFHAPQNYYGFLTSAEGSERGPWSLTFEATESFWMSMAIIVGLGPDARRMRQLLNGRSFETVLESGSIGNRVGLKGISNRFVDLLLSTAQPPKMAVIEIELDIDDLRDRYNLSRPLEVDQWYWLGVQKIPSAGDGCYVCERSEVDAQTLELADPTFDELTEIAELEALPPHPDQFTWRFSQAELQALHYVS